MFARLPTSLAVIYGAFTLGLHVAIQGPTLMDLIDLLHVNYDIMSYSLAFGSLAYSVGGLLSGFLFNYVNRQILIAIYFLIFGIANIATPFIGNFMIYSVITVFKMMCAGGTDCGANVWMLELRPGQDAWLQALHFSFAIGCALGPLIVEPFLGSELPEHQQEPLAGKISGSAVITSEQPSESRIYVPYALSGLACILAAVYILVLYYLEKRHKQSKQQLEKLRLSQQAALQLNNAPKQAGGEQILLASIQHPAVLEAGQLMLQPAHLHISDPPSVPESPNPPAKLASGNPLSSSAQFLPASAEQQPQQQQPQQQQPGEDQPQTEEPTAVVATGAAPATPPASPVKITSRAREQAAGTRPPVYVILSIALAATCLSFYCGVEITSMNYLASFATNIALQLSKSTAALMSSALTISFAVGRVLGILVAAHVKPHKLFYMCASIMATGNILMLIFANSAETLLWCSICLFGIGCGPMFPAIVSFFDDRISKVTNTVSGIFILGSMFNVALNSVLIGHQIIYNPLILIIFNIVGSFVLMLLFGTLHMLTRMKKSQRIKKFRRLQASGVSAASASAQVKQPQGEATVASPSAAVESATLQEEPLLAGQQVEASQTDIGQAGLSSEQQQQQL